MILLLEQLPLFFQHLNMDNLVMLLTCRNFKSEFLQIYFENLSSDSLSASWDINNRGKKVVASTASI